MNAKQMEDWECLVKSAEQVVESYRENPTTIPKMYPLLIAVHQIVWRAREYVAASQYNYAVEEACFPIAERERATLAETRAYDALVAAVGDVAPPAEVEEATPDVHEPTCHPEPTPGAD